MAKDPVCGKDIDEEEARQQTGQTRFGAMEVDPQKGTRRFHNGTWLLLLRPGVSQQVHGKPGVLYRSRLQLSREGNHGLLHRR